MLAAVITVMIGLQSAELTCKPFDISGQMQCRHAPEWSAMVDELRRVEI